LDTFYPFGSQASLFPMLVILLSPVGILQHKVLTELNTGTGSLSLPPEASSPTQQL